MGRRDVENRQPQYHHPKWKQKSQHIPSNEEQPRQRESLIKSIYDSVAKDGQAKRYDDCEYHAESKYYALRMDTYLPPAELFPFLAAVEIRAVRRAYQYLDALDEIPHGEKARHPHPHGTSLSYGVLYIGAESNRHLLRHVVRDSVENKINLRCHDIKHHIHEKHKKRDEAHYEIICGSRCHVIPAERVIVLFDVDAEEINNFVQLVHFDNILLNQPIHDITFEISQSPIYGILIHHK